MRSQTRDPTRPVGGLRVLLRSWLERLGLVSAPPGESAYHAFISYSHAVDGALAPALQHGLQRFAKPWYRARALRVFRDEASLSANPGLWSSIEHALDSSLYFILLGSPAAASSPWVAREAAHWRATKPIENLVIGLTEGELVWDDGAGDFDWERQIALPETLRGAFREEPRFIDLRWAHASEHLSLSDARFRDAVAEFAAPLHGVPKDVLAGEEVRQHRRTVRTARAAAIALACLTLASIVFGSFAVLQRNEARRQRDTATARSLSAGASANLDTRIDLAALLSLEAYRAKPSPETRGGLTRVLQRSEHIVGLFHADQPVERIAFSLDRTKLAVAGIRNVTLLNLERGREVDAVLPVRGAKSMALSADDTTLAVGGPRAISLWRLDGTPALSRRIPVREAKALTFFGRGHELRLGVVGRSALSVFDARSGNRLWSRSVGPDVSAASFSPNGEIVAAGASNELQIVGTQRDAPIRRIGLSLPLRAVAFSHDGRTMAGIDVAGGFATVWRLATRDVVRRISVPEVAQSVAFTPDGRLALGMADGSVVLEPIRDSRPRQVLHGPTEPVFDIAFPDGGPLATAGEQGIVVLWDPSTSALQRTMVHLGPISDIDFANGANDVAAGGLLDEVVTVWRLASDRASRRARRAVSADAVAIDSRGERLAVAGRGVSLYEVDGRSRQLQRPVAGDRVRALALSSRDIVAWGLRGRVALWDASAARRLEPLRVQGTPVSLAFSDSGLLAVAGTNGVTLWDPLEQRLVAEPVQDVEVQAVAIARSGDVLAYASAGRVTLWDLRNDRMRFSIAMPENVSLALAMSPDGGTLAVGTSGSADQLLLIDTDSGRVLGGALTVPGGPVTRLDFSPDGTMLATGTQGGELTFWDAVLWSDVAAMKKRLCEVAGRSLTPEEWRELVSGRPYEASCP